MADTGSIAALLHEFIESVDQEAGELVQDKKAGGFPKQINVDLEPGPAQKGRLKVFEERLAKLKSEDRDEFHRMLKQIHG